MESSNMFNSENDSVSIEEHVEVTENENERIMYMPTLPSTFKSLVGIPLKMKSEEPQYLIELLGDLLGVTDYKTNKAAFWFLDTIALQVLRSKGRLDDQYRSILVSWLAGEMKLIRDKKLLREDFFNEMKILFLYVAERLSRGEPLLHWELLIDEYFQITSSNSSVDISPKTSVEDTTTYKSSKEELMYENSEYPFLKKKLSVIRKNHVSGKIMSMTNNSQEKLSKSSKISLTMQHSQVNMSNTNNALDIIIETTYNMYANELRYTLIRAIFVTPIRMHICHMPHTLQIPRQIRSAEFGAKPFNLHLQERLQKIGNQSISVKEDKAKSEISGKAEFIIKKQNMETPMTPPPSLIDEEMLASNRRFILPLIEAKEVVQIFETHAENI